MKENIFLNTITQCKLQHKGNCEQIFTNMLTSKYFRASFYLSCVIWLPNNGLSLSQITDSVPLNLWDKEVYSISLLRITLCLSYHFPPSLCPPTHSRPSWSAATSIGKLVICRLKISVYKLSANSVHDLFLTVLIQNGRNVQRCIYMCTPQSSVYNSRMIGQKKIIYRNADWLSKF